MRPIQVLLGLRLKGQTREGARFPFRCARLLYPWPGSASIPACRRGLCAGLSPAGTGRRTSPETIAVDLCAAVLSVGYRSVASRGAAPCLLLWSLAPTDPVIVRLCCRACLFWFPPLPIRKNSASLHSCIGFSAWNQGRTRLGSTLANELQESCSTAVGRSVCPCWNVPA